MGIGSGFRFKLMDEQICGGCRPGRVGSVWVRVPFPINGRANLRGVGRVPFPINGRPDFWVRVGSGQMYVRNEVSL